MTTDAFLAAILADPADDSPRLVYADWLDEQDDAARAEFIRVQCELAALEAGADEPSLDDGEPVENLAIKWDIRDCKIEILRRRERELLFDNWPNWCLDLGLTGLTIRCGDDNDFSACRNHDEKVFRFSFRRGFPESVTVPMSATLLGGPCRRCDGDGQAHGSDRPFEWSPNPDDRKCPVCKGERATPGILGDLFGSAPITQVSVTDREPAGIGRDLFVWWLSEEYSWHVQPFRVPPELAPYLKGRPFNNGGTARGLSYPTRDLALAALSSSVVSLGRSAAKGQTRRVKCERCGGLGQRRFYHPVEIEHVEDCESCHGTGTVSVNGLPPLSPPAAPSPAPAPPPVTSARRSDA